MALTNYSVKPYDYIDEWLEENNVSQSGLARRMGVSAKHITKLKQGDALSVDVALKLERVTGIPAKFWGRAEALYREDIARLEEAKQLESADIPVTDRVLAALRKRGSISATQHPGQKGFLCQELMRLMGVGSWSLFEAKMELPNDASIAYRQNNNTDTAAVALWLQLGLIELESIDPIGEYDREGLERLIPELRALTLSPPAHFGVRLVEMLNNVGVYLMYVPDLPGTGTFGATRWVNGNPFIQLSLRNKGDDVFWFTLFHEIGHVLLHSHDGVFVNQGGEGKPVYEQAADDFATDILIPAEYADQLGPGITLTKVDHIARQANIAPGIVVGRCHHEGFLDHSIGRKKIRSLEVSESDDGVAV